MQSPTWRTEETQAEEQHSAGPPREGEHGRAVARCGLRGQGLGRGEGGRRRWESDLVAMSSSSPPQPQYSLGKPFIFRYWSGVSAETPPKYWGYGRLGREILVGSSGPLGYLLPTIPQLASFPWRWYPCFQHPLMPPTCIQTYSWRQQRAGAPGGHTRTDCGRSLAEGPRRAGTGSPTLHHAGPPARPRSAALPC